MDTDRPSNPDEPKPARRIVGIMATYHRAELVLKYLDLLDLQIVAPSIVLVVDNGRDASLSDAIQRRHGKVQVEYLDAGGNLGPAGALQLGLSRLSDSLSDEDLVVHMDDDDPPVDERQLALLIDHLDDLRNTDDSVGAIGLSGGTLNTRLGMIGKVASQPDFADVDHLHGGYIPVYVAKALREVGGNDPSYFYGFEELELGRRLRNAGWRLVVDNRLMATLVPAYPKRHGRYSTTVATIDQSWSRFHKERNLLRILRREHLWFAIAFTILARHVAKPLALMMRSPRAGARRLLLGLRASGSGLLGSGGIDSRYPPPTP